MITIFEDCGFVHGSSVEEATSLEQGQGHCTIVLDGSFDCCTFDG